MGMGGIDPQHAIAAIIVQRDRFVLEGKPPRLDEPGEIEAAPDDPAMQGKPQIDEICQNCRERVRIRIGAAVIRQSLTTGTGLEGRDEGRAPLQELAEFDFLHAEGGDERPRAGAVDGLVREGDREREAALIEVEFEDP